MERPILFNTAMVRAILEGKKTQTRRLLKQPFEVHPNGYITKPRGNERLVPYKPPCEIGDTLWVRETFADTWTPDGFTGFVYKADGEPAKFPYWGNSRQSKDEVWRPSIHIPRKAARIFLKVTNVKVERLQDITEEDAIAEGVTEEQAYNCNGWSPSFYDPDGGGYPDYIAAFSYIWDLIYKNWDANPWVWVIEFETSKRLEK